MNNSGLSQLYYKCSYALSTFITLCWKYEFKSEVLQGASNPTCNTMYQFEKVTDVELSYDGVLEITIWEPRRNTNEFVDLAPSHRLVIKTSGWIVLRVKLANGRWWWLILTSESMHGILYDVWWRDESVSNIFAFICTLIYMMLCVLAFCSASWSYIVVKLCMIC